MNNYLASFYIGETDGPDDFQISEVTQYMLENWESKAIAKLVWENLEIKSVSIEENRAYDDDDSTYYNNDDNDNDGDDNDNDDEVMVMAIIMMMMMMLNVMMMIAYHGCGNIICKGMPKASAQ